MNPRYDFRDQVALVTGASSGMGLATSRAFAEAGAAVVLADIDEASVRQASEALSTAGHRAVAVVCDVSDEGQAAAMVAHTIATFGRLDMAYDNAGILGPMGDVTDESYVAGSASARSSPWPAATTPKSSRPPAASGLMIRAGTSLGRSGSEVPYSKRSYR